MNEVYKTLALAQRDLMKFLRDRSRIFATFIFPIVFLGIFGPTLNAGYSNLGSKAPYNFMDYIFAGILLQTVFQSSFAGITSLILDREKDFAMSIFVAPVSRISIVLGKILGESLVSFAQLFGIIIFGKIIGVSFGIDKLIEILPLCLLGCIVGGSFGILVASRIEKPESAQQIFPFLIFPMIFLSGAFTPVNNLPLFLNVLKLINPIFYGVDMVRNVLFADTPGLHAAVSNSFSFDLVIFVILGVIFFSAGTFLFTQKEGNK